MSDPVDLDELEADELTAIDVVEAFIAEQVGWHTPAMRDQAAELLGALALEGLTVAPAALVARLRQAERENYRMTLLYEMVPPEKDALAVIDTLREALATAEAERDELDACLLSTQGYVVDMELHRAEVVSLREALAAVTVQRDINLERAVAAENDRDARDRESREALATAEALCKAAVAIIDGTTYTDDVSDQYDEALAAWRSSRPVDPPQREVAPCGQHELLEDWRACLAFVRLDGTEES